MTDVHPFYHSDASHALDAFSVTLANMKVDNPRILSEEDWEDVFELVGTDTFRAMRDGKAMEAVKHLSNVTLKFTYEDVPKSFQFRLHELIHMIGLL